MKLRSKLSLLFLATIVIPVMLIIIAIPPFYHQSMKDQITQSADGILTALTYNIEMYLDDLERLTIAPYVNSEVMGALKLKASKHYDQLDPYGKMLSEKALIFTLPNQMRNTRKDIMGTVLLPFDGTVYVVTPSSQFTPIYDYPYGEQFWYEKAIAADGRVAFIGTHPQDYFPSTISREVFSVARLIKDPDSGQPLAVMMAEADTVVLERIIKEIRFRVGSTVAIFDDNHKLIYANRPMSDHVMEQLSSGQTAVKDNNDIYATVSKKLERSRWSIIVLLSTNDIKQQVRWVYIACYVFALIGLIVTLLLYFTLSHWMIVPFRNMIHVMKSVQRGDLSNRVTVQGKDEVAQLGNALNTMIIQLKDLIDREYRAVLSKRDAEFKALQSQIQPHFLYNTLNGFIALNRTGQTEQLEEAIFSLSHMLRYILEHNEWTTVREEFDFLGQYCELQRIRFEDRLQVSIHVEGDMETIRIPKLLLQPLVENAIIHGMEPKDGPAHLLISASQAVTAGESVLRMNIEDDGVGFEESPEASTGNVGLSNVKERLKLSYENAVFLITSKSGSGTHISIEIPMKDVER